jgi:hypothetical protein
MALTEWMKDYANVRLGELHMPGSHDAGTSEGYIDLTVAGTVSNAATQNLTITQQIEAGTRFFDLRLAVNNKKVVAHHTTAGQGAYSKISVDDVLKDAADFCDRHRSEIVIFRISHTSANTKADEIAIASAGARLHKGTGNLCMKTLAEIAREGNLICIFDDSKFKIDQAKGIHGYSKFKTVGNGAGIATCGCYSGTHKLDEVICNGLKGQFVHNVQHGNTHDHLWQVYWQKTYTNPLSGTGIKGGATKGARLTFVDGKAHGGTHAATGYMISLMKGLGGPQGTSEFKVQSKETTCVISKTVVKPKVMYSTRSFRNYSLPNIFSYDFVNEETNKVIVRMNDKSLQTVRDDNL